MNKSKGSTWFSFVCGADPWAYPLPLWCFVVPAQRCDLLSRNQHFIRTVSLPILDTTFFDFGGVCCHFLFTRWCCEVFSLCIIRASLSRSRLRVKVERLQALIQGAKRLQVAADQQHPLEAWSGYCFGGKADWKKTLRKQTDYWLKSCRIQRPG